MDRRYARVKWGPGNPRARTKTWNEPVKWNKKAKETGVRAKVFCASLADYLDEEVPHQWREDLFDLIEKCDSLDWLMLTKRIQNAMTMLPPSWILNPRPWVWLGTTAENQKYWDLRVPVLQKIPAVVRWVSYEPSLGPIDMSLLNDNFVDIDDGSQTPGIDWVIAGGESSQMEPARRFYLEWAEQAISQCRESGVSVFVKQLGSNAYMNGERFITKDKSGSDPSEWPESIRVREFPVRSIA